MTSEHRSQPPAVGRPAVEDNRPPRGVLRIVNPVLRTLLRSPLHGLLSAWLMVLSVDGRRSGRTYDVVVGRHQFDRTLLVSASGGWRHNLQGGAPVRITLAGRERTGQAELVDDVGEVARIFKDLLDGIGIRRAGLLGLKVNVARPPTADEIRPAVRRRGIVRVELTDAAS